MEGKIDRDGLLHIKRAGDFKNQYCPFCWSREQGSTGRPLAVPCGDPCPLFGEPEKEYRVYDQLYPDGKIQALPFDFEPPICQAQFHFLGYRLSICQSKILRFEKFTDERIQHEKNPSTP